MMVADAALRVDEIMRRPVLIEEGAPDRVIAVDRDRIADLEVGDGGAHVLAALLEREFGRVHADHDQPLVAVFLSPGAHVRDRAQAVDAGIGPEIDQHDLALEPFHGQWRRVEPFHRAVERRRRQRPLDRQRLVARVGLATHHHAGTARHGAAAARHHHGRFRLRVCRF